MQAAGCMSTGREAVSYTRWHYVDSAIPHVAAPNARLPGDGRWVERELAAAAEPVNGRLASDVERGAGTDVAAAAAGRPWKSQTRDGGRTQSPRRPTTAWTCLMTTGGTGSLGPGIFAEDAEVPVTVAALLQQGTSAPARTHLTIMAGFAEASYRRLDGAGDARIGEYGRSAPLINWLAACSDSAGNGPVARRPGRVSDTL
jgi:hypothetical protein